MKSRGAALLALTGDIEFNRDTRAKAVQLGMHLNEFGLWRWQTKDNDRAVSNPDASVDEDSGFWELARAETEEEILKVLGIEYVEPGRRNYEFVVGRPSKVKGGTKGRPRTN